MSYGLLLLRVVVGWTMCGHGAQKLFGWFGGGGPKGTAGFLGQLGFRAPLLFAVFAGPGRKRRSSLRGWVLDAAGCTRDGDRDAERDQDDPLVQGLLERQRRHRVPLTLLTIAVALAATGPGRFSVDRAFGLDDNLSGVWWDIGVLGVAAAVSFLILTVARRRQRLQAAAA